MANNKNLKPFKPGESGNPKGRPKGALDKKKAVRDRLNELCDIGISEHNMETADELASFIKLSLKRSCKEGRSDIDILTDATFNDLLVNRLIYSAIFEDDNQAANMLWDRAYGKSIQNVKPENTLTSDQVTVYLPMKEEIPED